VDSDIRLEYVQECALLDFKQDGVMLETTQSLETALEGSLKPPDRGRMWADLALTIRQAAAITGVSPRQIQHWLDRGYLPASIKGTRRISGNALDLIALIHQARLAGIPLRRAVPLAKDTLARLQVDPLSQMDIGREVVSDLEQKLAAAISAIDGVRRVMAQLDTAE
jgi:DNA-binding transcriptional MerR regulator